MKPHSFIILLTESGHIDQINGLIIYTECSFSPDSYDIHFIPFAVNRVPQSVNTLDNT